MWSYGSPSGSPARDAWTRESSLGRCSSAAETELSPTNTSVSQASTMSNGVKSRQIRDLKLEVEMRDHRIGELEEALEEIERKAAFSQGQLNCKLQEQDHSVQIMNKEQDTLKTKLTEQEKQMEEMRQQMEQYKQMTESFKMVMSRCAQLEEAQQKQLAAEKAKEEERAAVAAAAAEAKRREEAEAQKAEEEAAVRAAPAPQPQAAVAAPRPATATSRPVPSQQSGKMNKDGKKDKDCIIM